MQEVPETTVQERMNETLAAQQGRNLASVQGVQERIRATIDAQRKRLRGDRDRKAKEEKPDAFPLVPQEELNRNAFNRLLDHDARLLALERKPPPPAPLVPAIQEREPTIFRRSGDACLESAQMSESRSYNASGQIALDTVDIETNANVLDADAANNKIIVEQDGTYRVTIAGDLFTRAEIGDDVMVYIYIKVNGVADTVHLFCLESFPNFTPPGGYNLLDTHVYASRSWLVELSEDDEVTLWCSITRSSGSYATVKNPSLAIEQAKT